jgi:hypothetical protein
VDLASNADGVSARVGKCMLLLMTVGAAAPVIDGQSRVIEEVTTERDFFIAHWVVFWNRRLLEAGR